MRKIVKTTAVLLLLAVAVTGCPKKQLPPPILPPKETKTTEPTQPVTGEEKPVIKPPSLELKSVYFDYDKYDIRPDAKATLMDNAKQLMDYFAKYPTAKVRLEGNCDERGTNEYNLSLGQKRADAVKNFLINYGIPANKITTISYGEEKPVCTQSEESCWWKNRRVDFKIIE